MKFTSYPISNTLFSHQRSWPRLSLLVIFITIFISCKEQTTSDNSEHILARVGDRVINTREFLQRSEYTIRPPYCRDQSPVHKKIVLNSLIGEKLLALEAENKSQITNNPDFMAYLQGRKEQAMRQLQYYEEFYKSANPEDQVIREEMAYANRRYQISYISVKDQSIAENIARDISNNRSDLTTFYRSVSMDSVVPHREVSWSDYENPAIREALFIRKPQKGQVIGPINIDDQRYILIEVNGWIDKKIMTQQDYDEQYQLAFEKVKAEKSWDGYKEHVRQLMHGKQINFYEDTFREIIRIVAPLYTKSAKLKKEMFNNAFWQNNESMDAVNLWTDDLEQLNTSPFFSVNGRIWTVERFRAYLKKHPLQFRSEETKTKHFAEQFKLAVVDMVRDYYITADAYAKNYDKSEVVKNEVIVWRDHLLSLFEKYHYLESNQVQTLDQMEIVEKYLTPYIEQLQQKYSADIEINVMAFDQLELTGLDMIALQPDQAFPVVVPSFPLVTQNHRLDYGRLMQ